MWGKGKTHCDTDFYNRPEDNRSTVCISLEVLDGENPDDLDDRHEEAQGKYNNESDFLATTQLQVQEHGDGQGQNEYIVADGRSSQACTLKLAQSYSTV